MAAKKKSRRKEEQAQVEAPPDPREPVSAGAAVYEEILTALTAVLKDLQPPPEPRPSDLFEAMLHIAFADGLPCGYGQEATRRVAEGFVDRNEFRVSEAYEVEDQLRDLQLPAAFERCFAVRECVGQVYNDQNGMEMGFLREATISDRNSFFQRIPALKPHLVAYLNNLLTVEELVFSDKSILRVQQRLGMDPKDPAADKFVGELRELFKPFGHLPLGVGKNYPSGRVNPTHVLCPACILARLGPPGKRR